MDGSSYTSEQDEKRLSVTIHTALSGVDDVDEEGADNVEESGHFKVGNPACQISVRDERR